MLKITVLVFFLNTDFLGGEGDILWENAAAKIFKIKKYHKLVGIDWSLFSSPSYCHEFVNIVCTICINLFLYYNISDALKIFSSGEKSCEFN